ncbi:unnamed protein product, partial [Brachionus calyciflorus]
MSGYLPLNQADPIQIISNQNGKFVLDEKALKSILCDSAVENRPIYIISIIGSFRTGKSFILNKFLSYLTGTEMVGFKWSYGSSPHTKGIWMWNTPIQVNLDNGKEISVLLMDTQGTFDNDTSHQECATIFSLSAFMSSVQIYNIKNNIEKTHLEYLNLFAQYKQITENVLCKQFRFEQLCFLVRDWQYPEEIEYGFKGGEIFLNKRLQYCEKDANSEEIIEIAKNLDFYFRNKNCFLMPHPGQSIHKKDFCGFENEMDEQFNLCCNLFFEQTLQNLIIEESDFLRLSGENLFEKFKEYVGALNFQNLPDMESIATIYKKHNNIICKQNEILRYKNYFNKKVMTEDDNQPFIMKSLLSNEHENLMNEAITKLKFTLICRDDLEMDKEIESLKQDLMNLYFYFKQINKEKKFNFIQKLNKLCIDEYENSMKQCPIGIYVKPLTLFLRHQDAKSKFFEKYDKLRHENSEINTVCLKLNDSLDSRLEKYDVEIRLNNLKIINDIKRSSIEEYKKIMNDNKKSCMNSTSLHLRHQKALESSMEKLDELLQFDCDIDVDRESLANEIRGLFSEYLLENQTEKPNNLSSFKENLSLILKSKNGEIDEDKSNFALHKNPKDLLQATFY